MIVIKTFTNNEFRKTKQQWRAVYIERCKHGSGRGLCKPTAEIRQGGTFLLYNFGTFFGLFPNGLQRTLKFKAGLDVTMGKCESIIANIKSGYPAIPRWQAETIRRAAGRHYTETWLGRRRYLPGIGSTDWKTRTFMERCALNTPIQGTAADILKLALGRIIVGLPGRPWLRPLLQIHDELVFELPKDKAEEANAFVRECMEAQPFPDFDLPIIAEAAVGTSFGKL